MVLRDKDGKLLEANKGMSDRYLHGDMNDLYNTMLSHLMTAIFVASNRGNEFSVHTMFGGENYKWEGSIFIILYNHFQLKYLQGEKELEKEEGDDEPISLEEIENDTTTTSLNDIQKKAFRQAGIAMGRLLKYALITSKDEFEVVRKEFKGVVYKRTGRNMGWFEIDTKKYNPPVHL